MTSIERQDLLKQLYSAMGRAINGTGTDEDYHLECVFYTFLTDKLTTADWDRLANLIRG